MLWGGVRQAMQIEALQDREGLHTRDRAGRHGGAEQLVSPVGGAYRFEHLRLVGGEVLRAEDASVSSHLLVDGGRDLAPVEGVLAFSADPFEGVGKVPLDDLRTGRRRVSIRQEDARGLAIADQVGHGSGDHQAGGGVGSNPSLA